MMTAYYIAVMLVAFGALCNLVVTWKLLKRVKKLEARVDDLEHNFLVLIDKEAP